MEGKKGVMEETGLGREVEGPLEREVWLDRVVERDSRRFLGGFWTEEILSWSLRFIS